jgi:16S rRNA (guanine527-N7)-methyltransferase
VEFAEELERIIPPDVPHRENLIRGAARHLALIVEANKVLNLTRITDPREAATKHVLDSVMPWRLFEEAHHVLDAGTGAGFPGIPLALVLPETRFTLAESIQKKARFVEAVLAELNLPNVEITSRRAEEGAQGGGTVVRDRKLRADIITARALAPIPKILRLFRPALKAGSRLLLYKGPDVEREISEAGKVRERIEIVMRYDLPASFGCRTIVQIAASGSTA